MNLSSLLTLYVHTFVAVKIMLVIRFGERRQYLKIVCLTLSNERVVVYSLHFKNAKS